LKVRDFTCFRLSDRDFLQGTVEVYLTLGPHLLEPEAQYPWLRDNMRSVANALARNNVLRSIEVSWWNYAILRRQEMALPNSGLLTTFLTYIAEPLK